MTIPGSMFNRKRPTPDDASAVASLIAKGTRLAGDISFSGNLFLDGRIDGQIIATEPGALLTIGEQGQVRGNVRVPAAVIHGQVRGEVISTERLELASTARIDGDLYYRSIAVFAGAQVNGQMRHGAPDGDDLAAAPDEPTMPDALAQQAREEPATANEPTVEQASAPAPAPAGDWSAYDRQRTATHAETSPSRRGKRRKGND